MGYREQDIPRGREAIAYLTLAFHYQDKLKKIDPENELLKCALTEDGRTMEGAIIGFNAPPEFIERFGMPSSQAICTYKGQLEMEVQRLKAEKQQSI